MNLEASWNSIAVASIVIPVFNAAKYLEECLQSVLQQRRVALQSLELILYDDASTDGSFETVLKLRPQLEENLLRVKLLRGSSGPLGVGSARNRACIHAMSSVLIFLDADDMMHEYRVARTLEVVGENVAKEEQADLVGGPFERFPRGSTPRYEAYHRRLRTEDLFSHAFRDAPLAIPTVGCRKAVWDTVPFVEGHSVPEDLHFFYGAMKAGFRFKKLQGDSLTIYRFHDGMTSLSLHRRTLLSVRVRAFEDLVLTREGWREGFSIWNSGRDGKEVFKCLSDVAQQLVRVWGDVDPRKIGQRLRERPVVHFSRLTPPIACCVPLDREGREFEANLASLNLVPGTDYVHLI